MNPEFTKLQILNDLIAQTLDVITQRNLMAQRAALLGGGLAHTPYAADPRLAGTYGYGNIGFSHSPYTTPYSVDPRIAALTGFGVNAAGFSHSPYATPYGVDPRIAALSAVQSYGIDPRIGLPVSGWSQGLSHTAIDPRFTAHGIGVAHALAGFPQQGWSQAGWSQPGWNMSGLQHTPYVDPRLAYDPRIAYAGVQQLPVMGIDPRAIYGISPFGF